MMLLSDDLNELLEIHTNIFFFIITLKTTID